MLRVEGVDKHFPGVQALAGVELEVRAGEIHALVGENGAGKSTLVKVIGGALRPDAGRVTLGGEPIPAGDPVAARQRGVGIIYQEFTLVPELSVAENIFLGQEPTRYGLLDRSRMRTAAVELLERLGCSEAPDTLVRTLSVGVCQLIEIARALATGSKLLVFDEPSATLTDRELDRLFKTMRQLRDEGMAIVYISHRLEEIDAVCDRVTVLRDGQHVATDEVAAVDRAQIIRWMVGRDLEEAPHVPAPRGKLRLQVEGLGCRPYFEDVSFDVAAGEIVGMAGLVGAGRTSVGLALFGMLSASHGTVRLNGELVSFRHPWQALRAGLGYLTEDRKGQGILPQLSVAENITISNLKDYTKAGFLSGSRRLADAQAARERFDIRTASLQKRIADLSGGNQQKALLARLLMHPLDVLVLDEPTRGVDVGARAEVYRIIRALAHEGVSIVMISSDLPELLEVCDRIVVLREGLSMGELPRDEATQERIMELATAEVRHA